jgi:foldase protein PrsA
VKSAPGAIATALGLVLLQGCAAKPVEAAAAPTAARESESTVAAPAPGSASSPASPAAGSTTDVVATIGSRPITMGQLLQPLIEAHGLTVLLNLVQLELAKDAARHEGVVVTDADFADEKKATLDKLFAEADQKIQDKIDAAVRKNKPEDAERLRKDMERDHEQLFDQFLANQKVTKPEFELFLQTNTYLRKIAEPKILAAITDEELRKSYEAEYGASVRVRHIQGTPIELGQALERIRAGEPFEAVARQASRNPQTAGLGGELPRFSLATAGLPENFKLAAFALKEGEVSSMVEAEGSWHIIKLEQKFAPKAVKFELVKESVRQNLKERTVQVAVKKYRDALAERARKELKISEPVMASQYAAKLADRDKQIKDQQEARRQMQRDRERDREELSKPPATGATAPATGATTAPGGPVPPATPERPLMPKHPGGGTDPAVPLPVSPSAAPSILDRDRDERPGQPGIVVPVPRPTPPPPRATDADPARATRPAQGTPAAPAGK